MELMKQEKSDSRDAFHVERLNTLIDDPNAPLTENPNGAESDAMAGILRNAEQGAGNRQGGLPGSWDDMGFGNVADSFWEEIQRGGIGREDLLRMFTGELYDPFYDIWLISEGIRQAKLPLNYHP